MYIAMLKFVTVSDEWKYLATSGKAGMIVAEPVGAAAAAIATTKVIAHFVRLG
jgi:hypothetical protein